MVLEYFGHEVIVAHRDTARADDNVITLQRALPPFNHCRALIRGNAPIGCHGTRPLGKVGKLNTVAIADLSRRGLGVPRDEFVSRGENSHAGLGIHGGVGASHRCEHRQVRRVQTKSRLENGVARLDVFPLGTDVTLGAVSGKTDCLFVEDLDFLYDENAVGPFWHGGPGHDLAAGAGGDGVGGYAACRDMFQHAQGVEGVGRATGVAIHRRLRKGRHIHIGVNGIRQNTPVGVFQRNRYGG